MSNNTQEILDKLAQLERTVDGERQKADKGLKVTILVYCILVLVVLGYTTYVFGAIKEQAQPGTIAAIIGSMVEKKIPQMEEYLKKNAKTQAPVWAKKTVDFGMGLIPRMEEMAKLQLDNVVNKMISKFKADFFPNLVKFCKENLDTTFKNADVVSDKELSKAISDQLVSKIDGELDKVVTDKFFHKINELRKEVDRVIAKKKSEMTKKELAEKRIILYWTFLVNHADVGESKFMDGIRFASMFMRAFDDLHINLERESYEP